MGSVIGLKDGSGNTLLEYAYDGFGKAYVKTSAGKVSIDEYTGSNYGNDRLFTSREYDKETKLYYYRARYYSAEQGRFISRDPLGIADDINLYSYVGNNPINYTDPSGLYSWSEFGDDANMASYMTAQETMSKMGGIGKIANGGIQATYGAGLTVGGATTCPETFGGGCLISIYGFGETSKGIGDMRDGVSELISGKRTQDGQNFASNFDLVNRTLDGSNASCGTKQIINVGLLFINPKKNIQEEAELGFRNFNAFKKIFGKAGEGMDWHHIVEQNSSNISKFGGEQIHNVNNIIKIPAELNKKINGYYSSIDITIDSSRRIRDVIKERDYATQRKFGTDVLKRFGGGGYLK